MKKNFPIPDSVLHAAYVRVAKEVGMARETFASRTENIEAIRRVIGPEYSHVPVDDIRDRILTCAKRGGWSVTVKGHGPSKAIKNHSEEYKRIIQSAEFKAYGERLKARFGHRCAMCYSSESLDTHHRTYDRLGHELETDCIPVCRKCHKVADVRRDREARAQNEITDECIDSSLLDYVEAQ